MGGPMIALHPIIAHFPVALLITSVILDALGVGFRRASLTQAGFSTLVGGGVGAALGALTGPEGSVRDAAAIGVLHRHELFAALTILLCLVLIGLRLWQVRGLAGTGVALYLTLAVALVVTLTLTGYYGGQLTYGLRQNSDFSRPNRGCWRLKWGFMPIIRPILGAEGPHCSKIVVLVGKEKT